MRPKKDRTDEYLDIRVDHDKKGLGCVNTTSYVGRNKDPYLVSCLESVRIIPFRLWTGWLMVVG